MTTLPLTIPLPVTRPKCGRQSLIEFPSLVVIVALTQWNQLAMYTNCHEGQWDATPTELEAIRRHVGEAWIEDHRGRVGALPSAARRRRAPPEAAEQSAPSCTSLSPVPDQIHTGVAPPGDGVTRPRNC